MIEIPEEGLRVWICNHEPNLKRAIKDEKQLARCRKIYTNYQGNCHTNGIPCDAKPYRIVKEKP